MRFWGFAVTLLLSVGVLTAETVMEGKGYTIVPSQEQKFDSKGRPIETLDYKRRISLEKGKMISAKDYRAEIAERQRLERVAKECGPWFESIQQLEDSQREAEKSTDPNAIATDKSEVSHTGAGIAAYIEAMRVFNSNMEEGGLVSKDARQLRAALEELLYRRGGEVLCGPGHGVDMRYPLELLLVRYQSWKAQRLPVDQLYAAKSADLWPGKVPKDAERVKKTVVLYPGEGGYISTGLYVPPGEVINIRCSSLTGSLTAQIGCHSDYLDPEIVPLDDNGNPMDDPYNPVAPNMSKVKMGWQKVTDNRPLWRWPDMVRCFKIEKRDMDIGHVLGGVLWFEWSGGRRPMEVEVSGCVQMPWFRLGIDTNEDWVNTISKYPAPWAEIQTKTIIFTVESKDVRDVKDMVALAQWWGKAASLMYRLSGRGLPTDSEAKNFRPAKREWGILDKKLVQMNPYAPNDAEENYREADAARIAAEAAAAQVAADGVDPALANRYGFEEEIPAEPDPVPVDRYGTVALKKPTRENEPKFTPTRIVDDTQISVGAGHSGYPIMCVHWGAGMMNLRELQKSGSWGALHEIGHNMGQGANGIFALPGNTEVICNFFGTCVMNLLNGTQFPRIMPDAWQGISEKVAKGTPDLWMRAAVFERLVFYMTLAHYFGVESVLAVVTDRYDKYPTKATADRLCCAWSKAVQRDLTPYFEIWGLPLSKETYTFVQDWPMWPTKEEKLTLFAPPVSTYVYRGDETADTTEPVAISNPEDAPTRRQLRSNLRNSL